MATQPTIHGEILGARTPLDLATVLLRYCRDQEAELYNYLQGAGPGRGRLDQIRKKALGAFPELNSGLNHEDCRKVLELLQPEPQIPMSVKVRGLALALDERAGRQFLREFLRRHGQKEWKAQPGDPLPMPYVSGDERNRISQAGHMPVPDPEKRYAEYYDRLPNLRLVPPLKEGWTIMLDTRFVHALDQLQSGKPIRYNITLGTAVLNRSSVKAVELDWDEFQEDGVWKFFRVRPVDPDAQVRRMNEVLVKARRATDILIFPELCTLPDGQQKLITEFQMKPGRIKLLVAGSCHAGDLRDGSRSDPPRNEVTVVFPALGSPRFVHCKFRPYSYPKMGPSGSEECVEAIRSERILRICLSKAWYLSVLICKDCLDHDETLMLVERLGVNLLLVPAYSDTLEPFRAYLQRLSWTNRAVVVVANNPIELIQAVNGGKLRDYQALFTVPLRKESVYPHQVPAGTPLPLLCYLNPAEKERQVRVI